MMRLVLVGAALVAGLLVAVLLLRHPAHEATRVTTTTTTTTTRARPVVRLHTVVRPLAERVTGALPAPLQDPSFVRDGARVLLLGGLDAADVSVDTVVAAGFHGARIVGHLPSVRHDTAAASIGGATYVFGGGNGASQLDEIVRIDPSGHSRVVARLPAASSDSTAAVLRGIAYVVGGYTGTRWLDTIVAYRPGRPARVVGRLPQPVRYAAVTAAAGRIVIAGGSFPSGSASAAVLAFDPRTRRVTRVGRLPQATTHAAAATIGRDAYVVGGRGAAPGTPTAAIVAVDVSRRNVRPVGELATARSDLAAVAVNSRILVAGGRDAVHTVATISELAPATRTTASARVADVYANDAANKLSGAARFARSLVYVPNSRSDTVDVIDPHTYRIVEHFAVGGLPQHVVPSWDLRHLYVTNDTGNSLTAIDPRTGKAARTIAVADPYNMYFTPDGRYAIVVAERMHRLDFRDAHTFRLHHSLTVPCVGVDHMDFSADGSYLLASCEFSGQLIKVDVASERLTGTLQLPGGGMPQDVKLSPDGRVFYVADMRANGLWEVDGDTLQKIGFVHTGIGVHGLYPSRDARYLYATNRGEGSISVLSFATRKVVAKWRLPGGGSPDMGGVSADGNVLWLSGRYNNVVYAISTRTGRLLKTIPVGSGPHGLCVWPQPGRYSLGHTGILR